MPRHLPISLTNGLLLVLIAAASARAQLAPTDGSKALRDLNLPRLAPGAPGKPDPLLRDESDKPRAGKAGKGPSVQVRQVILSCTDSEVVASLRRYAAAREGRSCDFSELEAMVSEMRDALSKAGFVGAGVWFPRQDITGGVIKVQVDLARLGQTVPAGDEKAPAYWTGILSRSGVVPGQLLKADKLETGLLMLERYEGAPVRGLLRPGSAEGMIDLSLQVPDETAPRYGIFVDNHGSRFTGSARAVVSADTQGIAGLPDRLSASGAFASGLDYGSLQYAFFPTDDGLRLGASFGLMDYQIVEGGLAGAGVEGRSEVYGLSASYPVFLRAEESLVLEFRADDRKVLESVTGDERGHRRIHSVSLGMQYAARSTSAATSASCFVTAGELRQLNDAAKAQDEAGPGTVGGYSKIKAEFVRQWATQAGVLLLGLEGQLAFQNLDPSEELVAGGPYGVRAYPVGEGSIDTGILCRAELTRPVGALAGWGFDGGVFADFGYFKPNNEGYSAYIGPERYHLAGWGLMLTGRNSGNSLFKAFIANNLGTNSGAGQGGVDADGRASDWRIWVQAGVSF